MNNEVFVITGEQMNYIKQEAEKIMNQLPDEPKSALMIIHFLQKHMEDIIGIRVKGINVHVKGGF